MNDQQSLNTMGSRKFGQRDHEFNCRNNCSQRRINANSYEPNNKATLQMKANLNDEYLEPNFQKSKNAHVLLMNGIYGELS